MARSTAPLPPLLLLDHDPVPDLATYEAAGGGVALRRAQELGRDGVLDLLDEARLRGRGGAGFPTATKWRGTLEVAAETDSQVYVVANAAEGEPGTAKDRRLLVHDPYRLLEGLLVAVHVLGAESAFVGVKEKFTAPLARLVAARDELREAGWAGADRIHVVPGPDLYLFGEETGMLEVVEGQLPLPRLLRPYQQGLFATQDRPNPTAVNNVETLQHVVGILAHGAEAFRSLGTEGSPGTMVFTVVGDVEAPGVHELPMGTPLRALLDIAGAGEVKAVYSGVSNAVITPDMLDLPLTFDDMERAGTGLGSGGFVVVGPDRPIVDVLAVLTHFLAVESCGAVTLVDAAGRSSPSAPSSGVTVVAVSASAAVAER
jgi:NADH-quinone oxidoreductase subunit F